MYPKKNVIIEVGKSMTTRDNNANIISCITPSVSTHVRKGGRPTRLDLFLEDFAPNIDLFDLQDSFPTWVYDVREDLLRKITRDFRFVCDVLAELEVDFKVKYPIEIDGKYKFADFYIEKSRTVILLISDFDRINVPIGMRTWKERWFAQMYNVVAVDRYDKEGLKDKLRKGLGLCTSER